MTKRDHRGRKYGWTQVRGSGLRIFGSLKSTETRLRHSVHVPSIRLRIFGSLKSTETQYPALREMAVELLRIFGSLKSTETARCGRDRCARYDALRIFGSLKSTETMMRRMRIRMRRMIENFRLAEEH